MAHPSDGEFPNWFVWWGWLMVLPGLLSIPFPPLGFLYLQLTVLWAGALGVLLGRTPPAPAGPILAP